MIEPYGQLPGSNEDVQMNSQEMGMFTTHEVAENRENGPLFYQQRSRGSSGTIDPNRTKSLLAGSGTRAKE